MIKKKFLIEVEFSQEEMQDVADLHDVSIQELTEDQIQQAFQNSLSAEFEGIKILPLDLTPQAKS